MGISGQHEDRVLMYRWWEIKAVSEFPSTFKNLIRAKLTRGEFSSGL